MLLFGLQKHHWHENVLPPSGMPLERPARKHETEYMYCKLNLLAILPIYDFYPLNTFLD